MLSFRAWLAPASAALCMISNLCAAPALTTIQDVLYKADGSKFNGILQIAWTSFQAADTSNIATQNVTVAVNNGYLHVLLVPTTNATPPAVYQVLYNSDGIIQFSEIWVVPPSTSPLRVADVRSSAAGAGAATSQVQISDVSGLRTELNIRPTMGASYAPTRAAIVDSNGGVGGASGNLSDCVHVDGTSGPCGTTSGGASTNFTDAENPAGVVDGSNAAFQLANSPNPATSLALFRNGLVLSNSTDFTVAGSTITFQPGSVPQPGDVLQASYRAGGGSSQGAIGAATPSCSRYTLSNNGTNWTMAVNGAGAVVGPAIVASTTQDVPLFALPPKGTIMGIREKTGVAWSGAAFSTLNLSVGDSAGGPSFYTAASYDLRAAASATNFRNTQLFKSSTDAGSNVVAHITANQILTAATIAGAVDIDACWVTLP
jgi:hypothetical protein